MKQPQSVPVPQRPDIFPGRLQTIAGWIYLPLHAVVFPLLLALLALRVPSLTEGPLAVILYGVGFLFAMTVFNRFLQEHFSRTLDHPFRFLWNIIGGYCTYLFITIALQMLLQTLGATINDDPNTEAIFSVTGRDYQYVKAMAIFIGPIVEEVIFRGTVFGSLSKKNRLVAYLVTFVLFALYHVWSYALSGDSSIWLNALLYLPPSLALCMVYERTGSLWTPIALHAVINIVAYSTAG